MYETIVVYYWPSSQICLSCKNGRPVTIGTDDDQNTNMATCDIDCKLNDGVNCPEEDPEEEEE